MAEETFLVSLGGRSWRLPALPWRITIEISRTIYDLAPVMDSLAAAPDSSLLFDRAQLDALALALWRAINHVDPTLSFDDFQNLPFNPVDLFINYSALARAIGMVKADAASAGASGGAGEQIGTRSSPSPATRRAGPGRRSSTK